MTTIAATDVVVTGGVDTHKDVHVAAALDQLGRVLTGPALLLGVLPPVAVAQLRDRGAQRAPLVGLHERHGCSST